MKPLVAVVADIREFDRYVWHVTPVQYVEAAVEASDVLPVVVPALGDRVDVEAVLARVDGVMLTGSKTNVHPSFYGAEPTTKHEPYDRDRDETSLALARAAIDAGVPLLAICRGIQELNVALGGTLATEIQEQDGRMDHRAPESDDSDVRFAHAHEIKPTDGGCLAPILGGEPLQVNSLHRQAVSRLAPKLQVEATAADGTIEAVSVIDAEAFAVGVQWHPEYWAKKDVASRKLFQAFGDAVRSHAAAR